MERKTQSQKDGRPGDVKEGQNTLPGDEAANLVGIPQSRTRATGGINQLDARHTIKQGPRENAVKLQPGPHQHA